MGKPFFLGKNKKYIQSKTVLQMITFTDKQHTATDQYSYIYKHANGVNKKNITLHICKSHQLLNSGLLI